MVLAICPWNDPLITPARKLGPALIAGNVVLLKAASQTPGIAIWVARLGLLRQAAAVRPEYIFALATWAAFGVLLIARVGAGWRGRRAAWLTLGGFGGAMLVLLAYFLRHAA